MTIACSSDVDVDADADAEKQLVGVWRDCLSRDSRYTFSDDNSYAYDDDEPVISRHLGGVYSVAGNIVHVDATDRADMSLSIGEVLGTNVWTQEGTWMPDEYGNVDTYERQIMGEFSRIQLIDDSVLGHPKFCRQVGG